MNVCQAGLEKANRFFWAICFFLVYMPGYSNHFIEILGFKNRINPHFFGCESRQTSHTKQSKKRISKRYSAFEGAVSSNI